VTSIGAIGYLRQESSEDNFEGLRSDYKRC